MGKIQVVRANAREILDSRGNPTVEASLFLSDGSVGTASVPAGASRGANEAIELRDSGRLRYHGLGVIDAVYHVNKLISPAISGINAFEQEEIDHTMMALDGTQDKSYLGANAILSVSLASARAAAASLCIPLFRYLGGCLGRHLPILMMNILNGGIHAQNGLDVQEFMILPTGAASFTEAMRIGCEIYHTLGRLLKADGYHTGIGDEGGFAPDMADTEEAITYIIRAVEEAGYDTETVKLGIDAATSSWYDGTVGYVLPKSGKCYTENELISYWEALVKRYPIYSIEDGLAEENFDGWRKLTERLGKEILLVGDDLFTTNRKRLRIGADFHVANAILIKPNQIGTLSETLDTLRLSHSLGYRTVISHRSGETEDATIADLAVASNADFIKAGAPARGERVAKYNRLLKIEAAFQDFSAYGEKV